MIEKGKKGYTPCPWCEVPQAWREADSRNRSFRVTPQQEAAMLGGALRGWMTHHAHGNLLGQLNDILATK